MPEQPSPHHDQPPANPPEEGSAPIDSTNIELVYDEELIRLFRLGASSAPAWRLLWLPSLPEDILNNPKVQDAIKVELISLLEKKEIENAAGLLKRFPLSNDIRNNVDVQEVVKSELIKLLSLGSVFVILDLLKEFPLPNDVINSQEVQDAIIIGFISFIHDSAFEDARKFLDFFPLPQEIVQNLVKEKLIELLRNGMLHHTRALIKAFPLLQSVLSTLEVQDAVRKGLIVLFRNQHIDNVFELVKEFNIPRDEKLRVALLYSGIPETDAPKEELQPVEHPDPYVQHASDFYDDNNVPLSIRRSKEVREHVLGSIFDDKRDRTVDTAAISARVTHWLSPKEYDLFARSTPGVLTLDKKGKVDTKRLAERIRVLLYADLGQPEIGRELENGIDHFGADAMLRYMNRQDLTRHDALHFMIAILQMQENSKLSPDEFSENILFQVARDGALYDQGTAHHHFATVTDTFKDRRKSSAVLAGIAKYRNIQELQTLAADLGSDPFGSWKNLKKLYEISTLLDRTEVLEELNAGKLPPKTRTYIETLAFHPNISTAAVIQFWKHPDVFLDVDDAHTPEEVNRVKKPTNLLSLPFLGLRAEDLRDALINGELDRVQVLPPMQAEYRFAEARKNLREEVQRALGSKKEGVAGVARNVQKLFHQIKHEVFAKNQEKLTAFLEGKEELSDREKAKLEELLNDEKIGLPLKGKTEVYRATLYPKSSPEGVVAGNDTASCMPFGSGKNNAYMFNPVYAQMVVERLNEDGKWRTAAQSVMSLDHETSTPTPELMDAYLKQGKHIKDLVKPGDLERAPVVTCDNIEIAKNEEGQRVQNLREVYQKFFTEYLALHAETLRVNRTKVAVGTGYTPSDIGFRAVENRYIPTAPAGYSDNVHAKCLEIDTGLPAQEEKKRTEVTPLTVRDAVSIAVLEGKAYSDNVNLLENLHKMQNNLIGMEIANRHFDRPNLSFLYRDGNGSPRGYLLAYEGVEGGEPFVFLDDLATDREGDAKSGGLLIKKFFEAYLGAYGKDGKPHLPIFTNARDTTSFPLMSHAERFAKRYGLLARVVELGTHERGDDLMHDVVVVIGKTEEELTGQERKMRAVF